eukprot:7564801-Alexandrium_andersonii.AAC.1
MCPAGLVLLAPLSSLTVLVLGRVVSLPLPFVVRASVFVASRQRATMMASGGRSAQQLPGC